MSQPIPARRFRFGIFEADEATGELRKQGSRIKLHSQPFRVLVMLLERPSELVTREEMRQRLWGDDTFVDFDHGLNTAINKIREVLGDSAFQPRHIETVSGKGYRFIAPVTLAVSAAKLPQEPAAETPHPGASTTPSTRAASAATSASSRAPAMQSVKDTAETSRGTLLAAPHELPRASHTLVRGLLLLTQAMYLAFYLGALGNLAEIRRIFLEAQVLSPATLVTLLVATAAVLIPVRLFLIAAVAFDYQQLPAKFGRLFPVLLALDLLWALSPFLLVHHLSVGLALGMTAALVYMPFAQRSLVLMYGRGG
jgi:DNA-binding winged helix-turn-helix (wHTH) protein